MNNVLKTWKIAIADHIDATVEMVVDQDTRPDDYLGVFIDHWIDDMSWSINCVAGLLYGADGRTIVRSRLPHTYIHHYHSVFVPANKPSPTDWDNANEATKQAAIVQHGSLLNADIARVIEDWERVEAWLRDEWSYVGLEVTVHVDGVAVGSDSLWGIKNDAGDEHFDMLARECAGEAIYNAKQHIGEKIAKTTGRCNYPGRGEVMDIENGKVWVLRVGMGGGYIDPDEYHRFDDTGEMLDFLIDDLDLTGSAIAELIVSGHASLYEGNSIFEVAKDHSLMFAELKQYGSEADIPADVIEQLNRED